MDFTNLKDLYDRLTPALKSKKEELIRLDCDYITELDIWNYLKDKKWKNSYNLLLYQMVDDILNVENIVIMDYYKNKKSE
nr:hypothetical protein [Bacilli bacterium]